MLARCLRGFPGSGRDGGGGVGAGTGGVHFGPRTCVLTFVFVFVHRVFWRVCVCVSNDTVAADVWFTYYY